MAATFVCAILCSALSPSAAITVQQAQPDRMDVAFRELSRGDTAAAVERLESARGNDAAEPARLINLGTAYARQGRTAQAAAAFRAAIASDVQYSVELADGSWADSRDAARVALSRLSDRPALAMR